MGEMFSIPAGMMAEVKAHRLAFATKRNVAPDAFGRAFPDAKAFKKLHPAFQHEAALLARESGAHDAFFQAAGCMAQAMLSAQPRSRVPADHGADNGHGKVNGILQKLDEVEEQVADIIEIYTKAEPCSRVSAIDLYNRAKAEGVAPDCGAIRFAQELQRSHGAGSAGKNHTTHLFNRAFKW